MGVTKSEITEAITKLKSFDLKHTDFQIIKKHTDILVMAGCFGAEFKKYHQPIFRGRVVKPDKVFHHVNQISYPPKIESTTLTYNRLSTNKFQIFYGAMMPQEKRIDQITAMIEVGSIIADDFNGDEEYIQIGRWAVREAFPIAILGLHSHLASENTNAQELKKNHIELVETFGQEGELVNIVAEFMSHEFSKKVEKGNEWEYKISAAYGDGLFEAGIKAIQFPSVKAEGKSFNIALHRDIVDSSMEIEIAAITRLRKINEEIFIDWFLYSEKISEGIFRWREPPREAIIGESELRLIQKNMSQNEGRFINPEQ